jgi:ATP-binding cassette subfamily B protein
MFSFLNRIPIFLLLARGWSFARGYRGAMVFYFFLFALAQAMALSEPYVIGQLLNNVQTGLADSKEAWKNVSFYLLVYFGTQVFFWAFHGPGRVIERHVAFHIKANYKAYLFRVVTEKPMQWHREHHSGESINKINRATNALGAFFDGSFEISYMLFRLVGAIVFLFYFLPYAGWIALGTTISAFVVLALFDRYLYRQYDTLNDFENSVASAVHDYVSNIGSVITLRLESKVLHEVKERIAVALPLFNTNSKLNEIKWFIATLMITFMIVTVLWHYAFNALSVGTVILGGSFFTLFEYLRRIGESFYDFASLYGTVVKQAADVDGADTILGEQQVKSEHGHDELPDDWRTIAVQGLHFKYEDEKHRVHHLENLSITLERGKSIALVGESGCGKSTLLSLLRGVQQTDTALVIADGHVLSSNMRSLNTVTTLVPQDPEIFADTIRFNITFGLDVPEEEVMRCVRLARFESVLQRLPKGLETNIAEKGVNMSGGEKQRLALARGIHFAKDSSIVLLDEPTSSVDTYNERLIYSNLLDQFRDKCVISSIHKLHLLEMFDYIYVLEGGRIVEEGSFSDLLSAGGALAAMWNCYSTSTSSELLPAIAV